MQQTGQVGLSTNQWNGIIFNQELTKEIDMSIFQALYSFTDRLSDEVRRETIAKPAQTGLHSCCFLKMVMELGAIRNSKLKNLRVGWTEY